MVTTLPFEVITPVKVLIAGDVSEVVLPAHDGERGILPGHQDFVGVLGTGALKVVRNGDDFWYLVSSGVYTVSHGRLQILAELGEEPSDVPTDTLRQNLSEVETQLVSLALGVEFEKAKKAHSLIRARLEVRRRTSEVN